VHISTTTQLIEDPGSGAMPNSATRPRISVDAGVVRAHQPAAGARHDPPVDVAAEVVAPTELDTGGRAE